MEGLDIQSHMAEIHGLMGVCHQHDLLWGGLTAREHLLFYARLKGLKVCGGGGRGQGGMDPKYPKL